MPTPDATRTINFPAPESEFLGLMQAEGYVLTSRDQNPGGENVLVFARSDGYLATARSLPVGEKGEGVVDHVRLDFALAPLVWSQLSYKDRTALSGWLSGSLGNHRVEGGHYLLHVPRWLIERGISPLSELYPGNLFAILGWGGDLPRQRFANLSELAMAAMPHVAPRVQGLEAAGFHLLDQMDSIDVARQYSAPSPVAKPSFRRSKVGV